MRKLKELREHILTPGIADGLHAFIMELYGDSDIEEALNKSYKVADEYTNLCIEVVQEGHSVPEMKKVIDLLISLGADINRWNTRSGRYADGAENALTWAITHNKGLIVQHLIKKGGEADHAGDHTHLLAHFAGHLSPKQTRKLRMALGGRTPSTATPSRMGSEGGAPGQRGHAPRSHESGGGAGHGIPKGTRSRGASISKRKTRKQRKDK
jgi:hypothetical protein